MTGEKYVTVETLCAAVAVVWGGWVAYPGQTLFERAPALYGPLLLLAGGSETLAGLVFMLGGVLALYIWFKDGSSRRNRIKAGIVVTFIYGLFSSLYFIGDPSSPAGLMWFVLTAGNFIHLLFRWKN